MPGSLRAKEYPVAVRMYTLWPLLAQVTKPFDQRALTVLGQRLAVTLDEGL
jgi:hypothetical protein